MAHRLLRGLRFDFFIMLFVTAATMSLRCVCVSAAAEVHRVSAQHRPGTDAEYYYLRGKTARFSSMQDVAAAEDSRRAQLQLGRSDAFWQPRRRVSEETTPAEGDSVAVEDYTPCANDKHDPSVCPHN